MPGKYLCMGLNKLAKAIMGWRERKGFETDWNNMPEKLMLVVEECAEALGAHRINDEENFREEIADAMIRLLDISASLGIDIEREIHNKMVKNERRPHKHGKQY